MKNQQKLKILWKVVHKINKKFCNNKLVIEDLKLLTKREINKFGIICKKPWGVYLVEEKIIGIHEEISLVSSIEVCCHELTHAYQIQIENYHGKGHNQAGNRIYHQFIKYTDNFIKISV